jgi:hypothetical protein
VWISWKNYQKIDRLCHLHRSWCLWYGVARLDEFQDSERFFRVASVALLISSESVSWRLEVPRSPRLEIPRPTLSSRLLGRHFLCKSFWKHAQTITKASTSINFSHGKFQPWTESSVVVLSLQLYNVWHLFSRTYSNLKMSVLQCASPRHLFTLMEIELIAPCSLSEWDDIDPSYVWILTKQIGWATFWTIFSHSSGHSERQTPAGWRVLALLRHGVGRSGAGRGGSRGRDGGQVASRLATAAQKPTFRRRRRSRRSKRETFFYNWAGRLLVR